MKITIFTMAPQIGCSYYRGLGVIPKLKMIDPSIEVCYIDKCDWHSLADTDIMYIERPVHQPYFNAIRVAKNFGIPVWVDIDDNYFDIPIYNEVPYRMFMNEQCHQITKKSIALADHITVTTDELRVFYRKINPNVTVVPNAFNDYNYKLRYCFSEKPIVNWRGSDTHRGDMKTIRDELWRRSRERSNWTYSFIGGGDSLWETTTGEWKIKCSGITKRFEQSFISVTDYLNYIYEVNPSIQINPLIDNNFNRAKSVCSWIEATYAGAVVMAPDLPEWRKPGIVNYPKIKEMIYEYNGTPHPFWDASEMGEMLIELKDDIKKRRECYGASLDYIEKNLMLTKINWGRLHVIKKILGEKYTMPEQTVE